MNPLLRVLKSLLETLLRNAPANTEPGRRGVLEDLAAMLARLEAGVATHQIPAMLPEVLGAVELFVQKLNNERQSRIALLEETAERLRARARECPACAEELNSLAAAIEKEIPAARPPAQPSPAEPPPTGREEAAAPAPPELGSGYVVALYLNRLELIAGRFGVKVRDQLLRKLGDQLRQKLAPVSRIQQRGECAYLVSLERPNAQQFSIRSEIARVCTSVGEQYLEHEGRSILVPVTLAWNLWKTGDYVSGDALLQEVDNFIDRETQRQKGPLHRPMNRPRK